MLGRRRRSTAILRPLGRLVHADHPRGRASRKKPSLSDTAPASSSSVRAAASAPGSSSSARASASAGSGSTSSRARIRAAVSPSSGSDDAGVLGLDAERLEHVRDRGERRRAVPEQPVRADRERGRDLARHREHLAAFLEREVGGDQRAAPLARLDDDRRLREAGDDAVPGGKAPRRRLDAGRVLRHDQAALRDPGGELGVRGGVVAVDAAAEDGDGQPSGVERAPVRVAVDAAREAADDDEPGGGELAAEHPRDVGAVGGAAAGADDRRPRDDRASRARPARGRTGPPARRRSRPAPAGSSRAERGSQRRPRCSRPARYARSSNSRRKRAKRSLRGASIRCESVCAANAARASSLTRTGAPSACGTRALPRRARAGRPPPRPGPRSSGRCGRLGHGRGRRAAAARPRA